MCVSVVAAGVIRYACAGGARIHVACSVRSTARCHCELAATGGCQEIEANGRWEEDTTDGVRHCVAGGMVLLAAQEQVQAIQHIQGVLVRILHEEVPSTCAGRVS